MFEKHENIMQLSSCFLVLLERSHEYCLVLRCLEATMTKLGRSIDELQLYIFQSYPLCVYQQGLE